MLLPIHWKWNGIFGQKSHPLFSTWYIERHHKQRQPGMLSHHMHWARVVSMLRLCCPMATLINYKHINCVACTFTKATTQSESALQSPPSVFGIWCVCVFVYARTVLSCAHSNKSNKNGLRNDEQCVLDDYRIQCERARASSVRAFNKCACSGAWSLNYVSREKLVCAFRSQPPDRTGRAFIFETKWSTKWVMMCVCVCD